MVITRIPIKAIVPITINVFVGLNHMRDMPINIAAIGKNPCKTSENNAKTRPCICSDV